MQTIREKLEKYEGALKAEELAKLLNVSHLTVERRARRHQIPHFRVGILIRFDPGIISRWLEQCGG